MLSAWQRIGSQVMWNTSGKGRAQIFLSLKTPPPPTTTKTRNFSKHTVSAAATVPWNLLTMSHFFLSLSLSHCLPLFPPLSLSVCLVCLSVCLSHSLSVCVYVRLSECVFVYVRACMTRPGGGGGGGVGWGGALQLNHLTYIRSRTLTATLTEKEAYSELWELPPFVLTCARLWNWTWLLSMKPWLTSMNIDRLDASWGPLPFPSLRREHPPAPTPLHCTPAPSALPIHLSRHSFACSPSGL